MVFAIRGTARDVAPYDSCELLYCQCVWQELASWGKMPNTYVNAWSGGVIKLTLPSIVSVFTIVNLIRLGDVKMIHVHMHTGHDRRTRLCGRCHSWFLTEGARSRFCKSCRLESEYALTLPWLVQQDDERDIDPEAMIAGSPAAR